MKEKLDRILVVLVISIFFFMGCESSLTPVEKHINEDKIEAKSSSVKKENIDIKRIEGKLKAAANVVKIAIQNPHFRNELHRILKFYSNQENRFDAVSFAELESSKALHRNENYQGNISSSKVHDLIKNSFKKAELNNKYKTKSLNKFLVKDLANLYMPNLSDWDGKEIPTITWHPLDDEESSNVGFEPVLNSEKSKVQGWEKVTVDKRYGGKNPVLIIMPGKSFSYAPDNIEAGINSSDEVELSYIEPCKDCGGGGSGGGGNTGDNEEKKTTSYYPACEDENCDGPLEVQIGWVELNSYPCGWFCSGRRIYFAHQEAYQTLEDSPVTVETKRSSVYMDSGDRGNWIRYYTQFDHNWPSYQLVETIKNIYWKRRWF